MTCSSGILLAIKIWRARISAKDPTPEVPTFFPLSCWTLVTLGTAIRSNDGRSVRAKISRTSTRLTAAAIPVPSPYRNRSLRPTSPVWFEPPS